MRAASSLLSLNIYSGTTLLSLTDISPGFQMEFPLNTHILPLASILNEVFTSLTRTKQSVIDAGYLKCLFFESSNKTLSNQGCSLIDISASSATCSCSHMTSFAVFFDSGVDVITSSNYDVWLALSEITLHSLSKNIGFFIVIGWWSSLAIFALICCLFDSSKLK